MSELFPPRMRSGNEPRRTPRLLTSSQALEILDKEANFIAIAAMNLANQIPLTPEDTNRCLVAASKISKLRQESGVRYD
jgi:hypothetical protein